MNKKNLVAFVLFFLLFFQVGLMKNLAGSYVKMALVAFVAAIPATIFLAFIRRPLKKWYRRNFVKNYKYTRHNSSGSSKTSKKKPA